LEIVVNDSYPTFPAQVGDTFVRWNTINNEIEVREKTSTFISTNTRIPAESDLTAFLYRPCAAKNASIPQSNSDDWTHGNSLSQSENWKYMVYSSRSLNSVYIFDKQITEVVAVVGGPASTITFPNPSDVFTVQHSAYLLNENKLLVFDNAMYNTDRRSRALLLQLDLDAHTAVKIWDYHLSLNTSCFAQFTGSAVPFYTEEGIRHIIVDFPTCDWTNTNDGVSYVVELDGNGNELIAYEYHISGLWFNYRARGSQTVAGEYHPY